MRRWVKITLVSVMSVLVLVALFTPGLLRRGFGEIVWRDTTWSGNVSISGDTFVPPWVTLTIEPGTRVVVRAHFDDAPSWGDEGIEADGFNNDDPTRLKPYGRSHAAIFVAGTLLVRGTQQAPVVFTSDAAEPGLADWTGLVLEGKGHVVENLVLEHAKFGLAVPSGDPGIVVRNSTVRHALWGCFSLDGANGRFEDLLAEDCGHEGFDIDGSPTLLRVTVRDAHSGFVVLGGHPTIRDSRSGEDPQGPARAGATIVNHTVDPALACTEDRAWRWGDYVIPCRGRAYLA